LKNQANSGEDYSDMIAFGHLTITGALLNDYVRKYDGVLNADNFSHLKVIIYNNQQLKLLESI